VLGAEAPTRPAAVVPIQGKGGVALLTTLVPNTLEGRYALQAEGGKTPRPSAACERGTNVASEPTTGDGLQHEWSCKQAIADIVDLQRYAWRQDVRQAGEDVPDLMRCSVQHFDHDQGPQGQWTPNANGVPTAETGESQCSLHDAVQPSAAAVAQVEQDEPCDRCTGDQGHAQKPP
jgi:hypothetical protein